MKKALIFQNRICDIVALGATFPVSHEMFWTDCSDNASEQTHYFDGVSVTIKSPKTPEEIAAARKAEILGLLAQIDAKSIRPLREGDTDRVTALEAQAVPLRAELAAL